MPELIPRRIAFWTLLLILLPMSSAATDDAQSSRGLGIRSAEALLIGLYENLYAGDFLQVVSLTSRTPSGRTMTRRVQIVRKKSEPPGRAIVRFLDPPDVRGTSMLVVEQNGRDDDVFLFLPALGRTKRISSAQRFDRFFGTNLTYEDLEPKDAADFNARLEGSDQFEGRTCHRLRVTARPGVESQYDSVLSCVDPKHLVPLWTDYFVRGRRTKRLETDLSRIKVKQDGRVLPAKAVLTDVASGFATVIESESLQVWDRVPDRLFTTPNLELGSGDHDRRILGAASTD